MNNQESSNEVYLYDGLVDLFEKTQKIKLSSDEFNNITRIIEEKEETSYSKAIELLKSKL